MNTIEISGRKIGEGYPAYLIAEMSANHAGSIARAKEIIHAAKEAGADCVKVQTYTPDTITIDCQNEYFHIEKGTWEGENLYGLYQKAYMPWEWQEELLCEAKKVGIDFFSTPFDFTAVDFLESIGMEFYKIASFELVDLPLLRYVAKKGKPIIMSTGMASQKEIEEAVNAIYETGNHQLALMKCSSAYPAIPEEMHLSNIPDMKKRFQLPVGLSDHSMGHFSSATAVAMGANIIEKHFCLSREIENPDSSFSMTPDEFRAMVTEVRKVEAAMGTVSYGVMKQEESNALFRRSVFVVRDIKKGEVFDTTNLRCIRPGYGCKPKYYDEILGKTADRDLPFGTPFALHYISEECALKHLQDGKDLKDKNAILRMATKEDLKLYFEWANDESVRKNSFRQEKISLEDHTVWFEKRLHDPATILLVFEVNTTPVGQTRLSLDGEKAVISYSIDAKYRGQGYGTAMLQAVEEYVKKQRSDIRVLEAEVKAMNETSAHRFEKLLYTKETVCIYRKHLR